MEILTSTSRETGQDGLSEFLVQFADPAKLKGKSDAELLIVAARAMHSTLKLNDLYEVILRVLTVLTGARGAVLLVQRPRTHHPIVFKLHDGSSRSAVNMPTGVGREFLEWLQDRREDGRPFEETLDSVSHAIEAEIGAAAPSVRWVQMSNRGRLLGVLGVLAGDRGYESRAETLLVPLAEQAAIALDNAILYRQAERQSLETQILLESSRLLMSSLDLDEVLDAIMDSLQKAVPYNAAGIFLVNSDGEVERIVDRGYDLEGGSYLEGKAGKGLVGWVASTGKPLVIDDVSKDPRYEKARAATRSEMVVPITAGDRLVGVFNVERDILSGFFEADLDLVHAFAQHAGVAIERARMHAASMEQRRIKAELQTARNIQKTFQPGGDPIIPGVDVAGVNIPSEEVGGDYYDFIDIVEGQTGIAIADVSGKGIPAALIMASFRASLIAEIRNNYALRVIMEKVNRLLCERNNESRFVTGIYGVLDTRNRVLTFCNAGHNPGILRRADGTIFLLKEGGTALGIFKDAKYEERAVSLVPGDLLVFYTDGVTEAIGTDGSMFEIDRLIDLLHSMALRPARDIVVAVREAIRDFADPNAPDDDITMVVIRVL